MDYFGAIFGMGTQELILILIIVLLLFGGAKLPALFRSAGKSVRELKKGLDGHDDPEDKKVADKQAASKEQS